MAFTPTVYNIQYMGPAKRILTGAWTGLAGDAPGTMTFSGTVVSARFEKFDADNTFQGLARTQTTGAVSGISTLTIQNQDNVVNGWFTVELLGS